MKKQSREYNSIRNFAVGTLNQVLILFLSLISKSIFIHILGTVFMGVNGLFSNIFKLLSFAEFGIGSVMVYSLYDPINREDKNQISIVYHLFRKIYMAFSLITLAIGIALLPLLPLVINVGQSVSNISTYYILYLMAVIISNIYMYKSHIILADQKKYILSIYGLVFESTAILLQIIFLFKTKSYGIYLIVIICKNLLFGLMTSYKVDKLYPFLKEKIQIKQMSKEEKVGIYQKIIDVFGYRFARVFITGTDNILISIIVGTIWVGYYSNYDLIIMGVLSLVTTFYSAISASVGNLIAKEEIKDQYNIFETIQILNMWIVGFTTTSLYILFQDFITLWLGGEYILDFKIVVLIVINYYLVCNRKAITIFREASGMFNKIKYTMFLAAIINIVLSVILGYLIGLYGILLGTTITTISTYYWYEAKLLMKDKFSTSIMPFVKNQIETLFYTCLSILITSVFVMAIKGITILSFIIKIFICIIVPNLFYVLVLYRKDRFKNIVDMTVRNYKNIMGR